MQYQQIENSEYTFAIQLLDKEILKMPDICSCGKNNFTLQKDNSCKTSGICYRCNNYKCKKKFSVRNNTIFANFPKLKLTECFEVMKCCLCYEMNITAAYKYMTQSLKTTISKQAIRNIYKEIRNTLKRYYNISYKSEEFSIENGNEYFGIDESMFTHIKYNRQVWVIGIINNRTKNFVIEPVLNRDSDILKKFFDRTSDSSFVPKP